jgi:AcrR family transcriptional regulator
MSAAVNPRRPYDARGRRRRADEARARTLEAAHRLFLDRGYAGTTIGAISAAADVSPDSIYKSFGGKPGLVRTIWLRSLEGAGPVPAEQRSDAVRVAEHDPRALIRAWGTLVTEVAARVAPIVLLIRAAAESDGRMAELLAEVDEQRLRRMEVNARTLLDRHDLRPELTLEDARDIMWAYTSPDLYELLVVRRGWSAERFGAFVAHQLTAALLPIGALEDAST